MKRAVTVYSFADLTSVLSHPAYGQHILDGEGIGEIMIDKPNDRSAADVAADGAVLISKITNDMGTVTITAQQGSPAHKYLQGLFNYLCNAPSSEWAGITLLARADRMGTKHTCTGGAFQRESGRPYQVQGQRISWPLLFANIETLEF